MKKNFILTRHLTTAWNRDKRIQGQTDTELDKGGRKEAATLATKLQSLGIGSIVSSDLKRSSQTADIIASMLGMPVILDQRLRECAFGTLEGLTREQAIEQNGEEIVRSWDDQYASYDFNKYGGENRLQVLERHMDLINDILSLTSKDTILLVGHHRGLTTLLAALDHPPTLNRGDYKKMDINIRNHPMG